MDRSIEPMIPPSLSVTLERTLDLVQQLATDELELLRHELHDRVGDGLRRGAWMGLGALCLAAAWGAACAAAVVALEPWFSLEARLALLALSQWALGMWLVRFGLRERPETG